MSDLRQKRPLTIITIPKEKMDQYTKRFWGSAENIFVATEVQQIKSGGNKDTRALFITTAAIYVFKNKSFSGVELAHHFTVIDLTKVSYIEPDTLIIGFGGVMYQNHAEHQEQVAKYRQTHPTVISQKNVKQRVETQFDDDNVDAKVEVTGYDYSTGGSVIVKLNDSVLSVDKSDIDQAITSVCKALSKMNYKKYDGVNIKVEAENNDNYSTVGYAHVDKNNIPKVSKSNVTKYVANYQNNGND